MTATKTKKFGYCKNCAYCEKECKICHYEKTKHDTVIYIPDIYICGCKYFKEREG